MASLMLPTFDGTLGSLFIGTNISTILYGVSCVQIFMYAMSPRSKSDTWRLQSMVYLLFLLDTAHQVSTAMGMYRFVITDYLNPMLLGDTRRSGGAFYIHMEALFGGIMIALVQLFFAWRVWAFSLTISERWRWITTILTTCLALLTFASSMVIVVRTFPSIHSGPSVFTPTGKDALDWKIELPSAIACDLVITCAITLNLYRSRTGVRNTDDVLNVLILFTVNTGLITMLLSTASLICFLVLPQSVLAYVALEIIIPKCYINSLLATLNSREYLREKMTPDTPMSFGRTGGLSSMKFATNPTGGNQIIADENGDQPRRVSLFIQPSESNGVDVQDSGTNEKFHDSRDATITGATAA